MEAPTVELVLGPMDVVMPRIYIRVVIVFEHLPATEVLEKAFHRLVQREYKPWTGRLRTAAGGRFVVVYSKEDHVTAPLLVRKAPDGVSFASLAGTNRTFTSPMPVSFTHEHLFPTHPDEHVFIGHISRL